jgi:hypothetical protein
MSTQSNIQSDPVEIEQDVDTDDDYDYSYGCSCSMCTGYEPEVICPICEEYSYGYDGKTDNPDDDGNFCTDCSELYTTTERYR